MSWGIVILANLSSMNPEKLAQHVADLLLADALTDHPMGDSLDNQPLITNEQLIGDYPIIPGLIMTITNEKAGLFMNLSNGSRRQLTRQKNNTFTITAPLRSVTCRYNALGQLTFDLTQLYGRKMEAVKAELPSLSKPQLEAYQGVYYSEELDTHYDIVLKEHGLSY